MKILIAFTLVIAVVAIYVAWLRPLMRNTAWGKSLLDYVEPIERVLWWKSETILFARLKMLTGVLLTVLTQVGTLDVTPLLPLFSEQHQGLVKTLVGLSPLLITFIGWVDEILRKDTTKPLEIVAMRTDAPVEAKVAAAGAAAANTAAVAVIEENKAV